MPGLLPLHTFHGFDPKQHLLSLGLRDPNDAQPLRANGNDYVIAQCARGSKQVNISFYPALDRSLILDVGHTTTVSLLGHKTST